MKNIEIKGMSIVEMQAVKDAIADVLCWHHGFEAAKPDYNAPPGLRTLNDFAYELGMSINSRNDTIFSKPG